MIVRSRLVLVAALVAGTAVAQEGPKLVLPQPSPSATIKQTVGLTDVTVDYSSPAVRGRNHKMPRQPPKSRRGAYEPAA